MVVAFVLGFLADTEEIVVDMAMAVPVATGKYYIMERCELEESDRTFVFMM